MPAASVNSYKSADGWNRFKCIQSDGNEIDVESISLDKTELEITEGDSETITATVLPENATDKTVVWTSSDTEVAMVDTDGHVTAVKAGTAVITATASSGISASCHVSVTALPIEVTSISLDKDEINMLISSSETIVATILPEDADDKTVTWSSDNNNIAIVDAGGHVTAVGEGQTVITATASSGVSATCRVNVFSMPATSTATILSAEKLREGTVLEGIAEQPEGGNPDGWSYQWIIDNTVVSTSLEFTQVMTMPTGKDRATKTVSVTFRATNLSPQATLYGTIEQTKEVVIYRAPETPKSLMRKGDGTTHTLIAMMNLNNTEVEQLGYIFVYGHTDASGYDHIDGTTDKRYCQIDRLTFMDTSKRKWCYAQWTYPDGSIVTSGRRYLDGSSDETFDGSDFSGHALTSHSYSNPDNWITSSPNGVNITIDAISTATVSIFTISGDNVMTYIVSAGTYSNVNINEIIPSKGVYIIAITSDENRITKKIIM